MNVLSLFDLKGEKAIVTGGGQGLGREMALALAEAGADVALAQRHVEVAEKTADEIKKLGRDSLAIKMDVSKADDVQNMVNTVIEKFGKIDILINNAGIAQGKSFLGMSEEDWDTMMDIHVKGTFLCSQMVAREMVKLKKGSIINLSSMSGFIVNRPQKQTHYNTAKAAVAHFTKSLAMELAKYNIRVNAIAPGYMKTEMTGPVLNTDMAKEWLSLSPMGRFGEPYEIKGLALYLASRASSFVTGSVVLLDGGYCCW
ncbi:MAG: glucose 1-dehydrogenase [Dehalococcoidales bacterium]|nr:glucose 1-dehydrogenase [Dehalococcoidales bacterium]